MVCDPRDFFSESLEQSRVKTSIVAQYFFIWAKVIMPTAKSGDGKIAYIDLFAGPGRYDDGTKSTPLKIIEQAIGDFDMRQMLVAIFNDMAPAHAQSLEEAIKSLPDVGALKHKPTFLHSEVCDETVDLFAKMRLVPAFTFIDPHGYKGLSLPLIRALLKDWGSDCVFFFNYNRINMGLTNAVVESHMKVIFGEERLDELRGRLEELAPQEREEAIMQALAEALKGLGGNYVLPFRFRREAGRVSHYLVFVSKNFKGYELMKEVMARHSSSATDGVPSFEHDPREIRGQRQLPLGRPIVQLKKDLQRRYAGRRLTVRQVFERHSAGQPFIIKNYKEALKQMEAANQVRVDPPADKRPKRKGEVTLVDSALISFPIKVD